MLKIFTTLSVFLAGHLAQAQMQMDPFSGIAVEGNLKVIIAKSDAWMTEFISGGGEASAEVKNGVLNITADEGREAVVRVTSPKLSSVRAKGAAIVIDGNLDDAKLEIRLSGGASINGNLNADKLTLVAKTGSVVNAKVDAIALKGKFMGKSRVNLSGKTGRAILEADDKTLCLARNLISQRTTIRAAGESRMTVNSLGEIIINVDDTSKVTCIHTGNLRGKSDPLALAPGLNTY